MTGRGFDLGDVLTITTGRLVSPRHMDAVYDVLNWMTGDNLMTHQLPRAMDECQGSLLAQHPDLAAVATPGQFTGKDHVDQWLAEQRGRFGDTRVIEPLPPADHTHIHPLAELKMMRPDAEVIVVETGP